MHILFITSTRLGDAVLSSGLLGHLLERHPEARVTIACGPTAAPLFEDVPTLERVIVLEKQLWSLHWLGLWGRVAGRIWDVVVDLRRAPISYLIPSKRTYHLGREKKPRHRVLMYTEALNLQQPAAPTLWLSADRRRQADEIIGDAGPVLAIGPSANWQGKVWRAERFAELVERLTGVDGILPGARVALFGTAAERDSVQPLIRAIPKRRCLDLMGELGLLSVAAVIARCQFYIGNDSGLMHLAAAVGTPTLGLFGPSLETHYAPWGGKAMAVRGVVQWEALLRDMDKQAAETLMDSLSVDRVEEAAWKLWKRVS